MSGPSSRASEASISASNEPEEQSSSNAKSIRGGAKSSQPDSPMSRASRTWRLFTSNQRRELREMDVSPSLTEPGGFTQSPFLISSSEDSPARTCPSPANDAGSLAAEPDCSSTPAESSRLFDPAPFSSRTYPVSSLATAVGTSESCLERWPTSGTAWLGGLSTHVSSECRSDDAGCSSVELHLGDVLEPTSPEKYWLSARAAGGILRRATKRGRTIQPHLLWALSAVAGGSQATTSTGGGLGSLSGMGSGGPDDNDAQANRIVAVPLTSGGHPNSNAPGRRKEDDFNVVAFNPTGGGAKGLSESEDVAPGTGTGTGGTVAITTFTARGRDGETQIEEQTDGIHPALRSGRGGGRRDSGMTDGEIVRRLMPVECERLQGFPDGWTDLGDTPDTPRYSAMGDAVTVPVAEWIGGRL